MPRPRLHPMTIVCVAVALWSLVVAAGAQPRVLSAGPTDVAVPSQLTVTAAISIALQHQPALAIARSQASAARSRLTEANAAYYPTISPTYDYTNQRTSLLSGGIRSTATTDQGAGSVTLRQSLYDSGKREATVASARSAIRSADYGLADTRQSIVLNVSTAFYAVLRSQEILKVQEDAAARAKTTLEATQAFAREGTVRAIDVLQAEADYDNALVQVSIARNDIRLAQTSLKVAMGIVTRGDLVLASDGLPAVAEAADVRPLQEYVESAIKVRPDIKQDLESVTSAGENLRVAKINAGVTVEADLTASRLFDSSEREYHAVVASISYPLFDAGVTRSRVASARESVAQSGQQVELTRQRIIQDVEQAYLTREEARQRIQAASAALKAAQANFTAASTSYKAGAGTVLDVITARSQLVTAETNSVQATHDYYSADARLMRAVGANDADGSRR